jgi:diacylglycerol kinase family enzyme
LRKKSKAGTDRRGLESPCVRASRLSAAFFVSICGLAGLEIANGTITLHHTNPMGSPLTSNPAHGRKRFLIIHNPIAGMRRRWMLHEVCRHMRDEGAELTITHAESLEDDRRLARLAVEEGAFDAVIAAGGDSTVRGVASGLVGSELPMGIIPIGTGNVLAHELGMRHGPKAVAGYLLRGASIAVPAGWANNEHFSLMASAGFDARVLSRLDTVWKRRMGKLAYVWPVLSELVSKQPFFDVEVDGQARRCSWLIVTKVQRYGGPFRIARQQHLQSMQFHAAIITTRTRVGLAGAILAIGMGRAGKHSKVEILPCGSVAVIGGQKIATQLDGEPYAPPPLNITMSPQKLRLIVPPHFRTQPVNAVQSEGAEAVPIAPA